MVQKNTTIGVRSRQEIEEVAVQVGSFQSFQRKLGYQI